MKREEFLKKSLSGLGMFSILPLMSACEKANISTDTTETTSDVTGSTNGSSASDCSVTNSETEGPFPIKDPASLVKADIAGDRSGVKLTVNLTIKNKNANCNAVENLLVDIWHCDAKGEYSEYGGTGMQSTNWTAAHWLRGRQTTDANGLADFTSIFPGWYSGRAPHIHVHIFTAAGKSLLVTQIAFPKTVCDTVYTTATDYKSHGTQNTTNEKDNVFSDGYANELCSISGNNTDGYILNHTIVVSA
ncbi:intradiol ring-cleavage dioxygenase [Lacihabitans sp. LS3-19]|uniref:dioxygenase family protein n=1 Tax=Lacihabitans sp. LS3-19 TaxID=2487335 RepID=UPI0020CD8FC7|nr:intradiol ring-cleavage dioxygenase [Lacihabitans sp. LS3-19]MCP9769042.1 intradiol ring-cleavage dioxygenase [Lacihabitans sp. LS3-19]